MYGYLACPTTKKNKEKQRRRSSNIIQRTPHERAFPMADQFPILFQEVSLPSEPNHR